MNSSRSSILQVMCILFLWAFLLTGCAVVPVPTRSDRIGQNGPLGSCANFFSLLDKKTEEAGALDAGVFRVKKYPYLRVNRFIASFSEEVDKQADFAEWADRMQALDQEARKYEIANLPDAAVAELDSANGRTGLFSEVAT